MTHIPLTDKLETLLNEYSFTELLAACADVAVTLNQPNAASLLRAAHNQLTVTPIIPAHHQTLAASCVKRTKKA
jgi:hypothetical protein